jgi:hypothetical protein
MPSEKPATKTIKPSVSGVCAKAMAAHEITEITVLHQSSWNVVNRSLNLPRKSLESIVVPARIAKIAPTAYG